MGTESVPSSTLCLISGVANGDIFFGQKETGAERAAMATPLRVSFIQYFTIFSCKQYDVISSLILHNRKTSISLKRKRYLKKKNAILLYFERAFK